MAKEIKFNIKLNIDGKEQLVAATSTVENLRGVVNAAKSDIQKANAVFVNFNQQVMKFQNINGAVQQLASTLNSVTEDSRSFGAAMNEANTMAGKSGDDFSNLKEQVADLAKTVPVARDKLANGLYQVISNSVPEDNWLSFLNTSARSSVGGIADLGEVVKVTSTVIKNYGLEWDAAGDIQDKIQLTAKNGVTSFEQLAGALPRVTGNAATLGVSIDELLASFATLTGVSGDTNEVATQMAAIFTALVKPSSEACKMAQQMGIEFDAAAIKAAGGFSNFLTDLDKNVKSFAQSSGMLEQEIYGKLFGSAESLRALGRLTGQLAPKFKENVGLMKDSAGTMDESFNAVGKSGSATLQILKNKFAEVTDVISSALGGIMPYLDITSQVGSSIVSLLTLNQAIMTFCGVNVLAKIRVLATNAALIVSRSTMIGTAAVTRVLQAAFTGAAVGATTLKVAIKSLLISTGVGIAIWALTEAISYLATSSDKAANSVGGLSAEEEKAKALRQQEIQQRAEIVSAINTDIAKLKEFKGGKEAERKIVASMNNTYGETLGYYSTVAQWYTALTANSKAYCNQMINEVKIRKLANEIADLDEEEKGVLYDGNGKKRKYSTKRKVHTEKTTFSSGVNGGKVTLYTQVEEVGSSDLDKATATVKSIRNKKQTKKNELERLVRANNAISYKQTAGYSAAPPQTGTSSINPKNGTVGAKNGNVTPPPAEGSIDWYDNKLSEIRKKISASTDEAAAKSLQEEYDRIDALLKEKKLRIGIEKQEQPKDVEEKKVGDSYFNETDYRSREPEYIRKVYESAQNKANRIQTDLEIGLIDKGEAQRQIDALNEQISGLNGSLKPLKLDVDVDKKGFDKVFGDIKSGWGSIQGVGNGIQGISDALEGDGNAWQKITGLINGFISTAEGVQGIVKLYQMLTAATTAHTAASTTDAAATAGEAAASTANTAAKSGEAIANATASGAKLPFPANLIAIAAGVAAVVAALAAVSGFATGGVIGGSSTSGDRKFARVNSGEMILNKWQQARLFQIVNTPHFVPPTFTAPTQQRVDIPRMAELAPNILDVKVTLEGRTRGTDIVHTAENVRKIASKSGRRSRLV
jgi:TP901 family phage tail tape measure protein